MHLPLTALQVMLVLKHYYEAGARCMSEDGSAITGQETKFATACRLVGSTALP